MRSSYSKKPSRTPNGRWVPITLLPRQSAIIFVRYRDYASPAPAARTIGPVQGVGGRPRKPLPHSTSRLERVPGKIVSLPSHWPFINALAALLPRSTGMIISGRTGARPAPRAGRDPSGKEAFAVSTTGSTLTRTQQAPVGAQQMHVAMVAPPYFSVPPSAYGGIETVVADLVDALVAHGHKVTLIGAGNHTTRAQRFLSTFDEGPASQLGEVMPEIVHAAKVASLLEALDV